MCAGFLRFLCQSGNQLGALDDQVGLGQSDLGGTAVGEKLEAANFVQDAGTGGRTELIAEVVGDDERAGIRFEAGLRFEDTDTTSAARESGRGVKSGGRTAYDDNFVFVPVSPGCSCLSGTVFRWLPARGQAMAAATGFLRFHNRTVRRLARSG